MAKKPKNDDFSIESLFNDAIKQVRRDEKKDLIKTPLDVITYSEKLLGESLYPSQKVILKFFYAGTRFNGNLSLNKKDIEIIKKWDIEQTWILFGENSKIKKLEEICAFNKEKDQGEHKDKPYKFFKDLVLVIGRRASKSYMTALISSYEAYKLIMLKDPQKFYGINSDIYILNTAVTADQAKSEIFKEIRKFVYKCPAFDGRINHDKEYDDELRLFTDADIEINKNLDEKKRLSEGSIVLKSGSSNSSGLRGKAASMVIYDELAHFVDGTGGKSTSESVHNALSRSAATFFLKGDGRNIIISSPGGPSGYFHDLYEKSKRVGSMLMFQAPTWDINPTVPFEALADEFEKDPDWAICEYGARFKRKTSQIYFPNEKIDKAMSARDNWIKQKKGTPGKAYYLHIDAGDTSDRFAFMICHPESIYSHEAKSYIKYIIEDYSFFITPKVGEHIDPDEVMDNKILPLFNDFSICSVGFDGQLSLEQQKKLKKHSVTLNEIRFAGRQKNKLYDETRNLLMSERIVLCMDDVELEGEMKNIIIDHRKNPPKIDKNIESDFPYDDLVDSLCGCCYSINLGNEGVTRLPRSRLVRVGLR